jgi:hypothetical protein
MSKLLIGATAALATAAVSACASSSGDIRASYVSPLQYQGYTCQQISAEAARVSSRAAEVAGVQDTKRTNDQITTGVAIVVFWPAAFFVGGDGQAAAELARLKGEYEALEKIAIEKNCNVQFRKS